MIIISYKFDYSLNVSKWSSGIGVIENKVSMFESDVENRLRINHACAYTSLQVLRFLHSMAFSCMYMRELVGTIFVYSCM